MAGKSRYILPDLPHHSLQRGNNRQNIFFDKNDYEHFLSNLKKYFSETNTKIGAYCLMINHYHLMLYPETKEGLIKLMKSISQLHTQYINKKYGRTGKLWENRYKLTIVDPEYEWVIARYLELNPVRARMVKKTENHEYSSAKNHLRGKSDKVLGKDIVKSQQKQEEYYKFINEKRLNNNQLEEIRIILRQEKVFGNKKFIDQWEKRFKVSFRIRKRGRPGKNDVQ